MLRLRELTTRAARTAVAQAAAVSVPLGIFPRHSGLLKKYEILASSFDRLRMRPRVFNGLILMVSLSNHGQHHFLAS